MEQNKYKGVVQMVVAVLEIVVLVVVARVVVVVGVIVLFHLHVVDAKNFLVAGLFFSFSSFSFVFFVDH
jgi:hypothetical protein